MAILTPHHRDVNMASRSTRPDLGQQGRDGKGGIQAGGKVR